MSSGRAAVVCVKWGTAFAPDYVNVLYRATRAHLRELHRFVCVTDDPAGIDPGVVVQPFPPFRTPRERWRKTNFAKVAAFAPGVLDDDEIALQLDLDVMVVGELDPFFALYRRSPAMYTLREWNPVLIRALVPRPLWPDRGTQGSVYLYRAGEQRALFTRFDEHTDEVVARYRNDGFAFPELAWNPRYLPDAWCASFKHHCLSYWPLSLLRPPAVPPPATRLLCFHGSPRPLDLMQAPGVRWGTKRKFGTEPVPWVGEYWRRYGGTRREVRGER